MRKKLRSPIAYFGGKNCMVDKLLKFIPEHTTYVEVFGGGASLLLNKEPSEIEVYNDINFDLYNLFQVIRDENKFQKFQKLCYLTPYSRNEFNACRNSYEDEEDDIQRAWKFFITMRQSFSGKGDSWNFSIKTVERGMSKLVFSYLRVIEMLPEIHARLMRVQMDNKDFREIFKTYDSKDTFFYCDPPYVPSTRKSGKYICEMTEQDHIELIDILVKIKGKVLLSGYQNNIYIKLEDNGWNKATIDVPVHASLANNEVRDRREECLWYNYDIEGKLFDV